MPQPKSKLERLLVAPSNLVTPKLFETMSGITLASQVSKRTRGVWRQGREIVKDPDGKVMVDWRKVEEWHRGETH